LGRETSVRVHYFTTVRANKEIIRGLLSSQSAHCIRCADGVRLVAANGYTVDRRRARGFQTGDRGDVRSIGRWCDAGSDFLTRSCTPEARDHSRVHRAPGSRAVEKSAPPDAWHPWAATVRCRQAQSPPSEGSHCCTVWSSTASPPPPGAGFTRRSTVMMLPRPSGLGAPGIDCSTPLQLQGFTRPILTEVLLLPEAG
jgi:hypothetical protein